jgi:hypothetical protein
LVEYWEKADSEGGNLEEEVMVVVVQREVNEDRRIQPQWTTMCWENGKSCNTNSVRVHIGFGMDE